MPKAALRLPPGLYRQGTLYQSKGRWANASLVRFQDAAVRPIGGWLPINRADFYADPSYFLEDYVVPAFDIDGLVRSVLGWKANDSQSYLALGTTEALFVYANGDVTDITPSGLNAGHENTETGGSLYGTGSYSDGVYSEGDPTTATIVDADIWSIDTFGENLVGVMYPSDGELYEWAPDLMTPAAAVSGAPSNNRGVVVTEERFMLVLGADGNPRLIQWPSQETDSDWTPSATNSAGDLELATVGEIVTGRRLRNTTLILTTVDAHEVTYVGPPFFLGRHALGPGGIVGPNAVGIYGPNAAAWMGPQGFFKYDGFVAPLDCEVADYIFSDFNRMQARKVSCTPLAEFNELTWNYPSALSDENDRYATWNVLTNRWVFGELPRQGGIDRGVFRSPLMVTAEGVIYEHELGYDYGSLIPFIESGPMEIGDGEQTMTLLELIPDDKSVGDVEVEFFVGNYPDEAEVTKGPFSLTKRTDLRFSARQVRMRVQGARNTDWRWGVPRLNMVPAGAR